MAVHFKTGDPQGLWNEIIKHIQDGSIQTWEMDSDSEKTYLTHSTGGANGGQWYGRAWFTPIRGEGELIMEYELNPKGRESFEHLQPLYAVYHGRLAEMVLSHFNTHIIEIVIKPKEIKFSSPRRYFS